jgi:hypothetical protein
MPGIREPRAATAADPIGRGVRSPAPGEGVPLVAWRRDREARSDCPSDGRPSPSPFSVRACANLMMTADPVGGSRSSRGATPFNPWNAYSGKGHPHRALVSCAESGESCAARGHSFRPSPKPSPRASKGGCGASPCDTRGRGESTGRMAYEPLTYRSSPPRWSGAGQRGPPTPTGSPVPSLARSGGGLLRAGSPFTSRSSRGGTRPGSGLHDSRSFELGIGLQLASLDSRGLAL